LFWRSTLHERDKPRSQCTAMQRTYYVDCTYPHKSTITMIHTYYIDCTYPYKSIITTYYHKTTITMYYNAWFYAVIIKREYDRSPHNRMTACTSQYTSMWNPLYYGTVVRIPIPQCIHTYYIDQKKENMTVRPIIE